MTVTAEFKAKVLVPRLPPNTIHRPRLLKALQRRDDHGVLVVRAPAGFGKTTLLIDFVHELKGRVCWLSLDEWDRDAATYLHYLHLSVATCLNEHGLQPTAERPHRREPIAALGELAAMITEHGEDVWVVLDDFQSLAGYTDVTDLADYFARRLPPNCRLVISSRTPPQLESLPRLRLEGAVLELGPEDLAFTAAEIREYYRSARGVSISPERSESLLAFTQGWPAAVALIPDPESIGNSGPQSSLLLADYLAAEVYEQLPRDVQDFLLRGSVLDTLEAQACDWVLRRTGSEQILGDLEKRNLPVLRSRTAAPQFTIHPLFRDFLSSRLGVDSPKIHKALHRRAGEWHRRHERPNEAIWHLAQAEDWDGAAGLILNEAASAYGAGRWHSITSWLELMPEDERQRRPHLRLWEARILVRLGQADGALRVVSSAADSLRDDGVALAELETLRGTALRVRGDVSWALSSCRRAVELALSADAPIGVVGEARKQLGEAMYVSGLFADAARELNAALAIARQRGDREGTAYISGCLGSALCSLGKLQESANSLEQARLLWRSIGNDKELCWVLNNLAVTYQQMGQSDQARDLLRQSVAAARSAGHQRAEAYALASLGDIHRRMHDNEAAIERFEEAQRLAAEFADMTITAFALAGLSHAHRQAGDIGKAEMLANQALVSARERGNSYDEGLVQVALGSLRREQGSLDGAIAAFSGAVALFERVGARQELAEALFCLADSALPLRRERTLLRITLERLASIVTDLAGDHLLIEAASRAPAVVEYAASKRIAGRFYRDLLRRLRPGPDAREGRRAAAKKGSGRFPVVEVRALGAVEVSLEGRGILDAEWESEKAKELLLYLLSVRREVRRDEVVAALWPESGGAKASSAFHSTLHRLRSALYPESVITSHGGYSLNPDAALVYDVDDFELLVDSATRANDDSPERREAMQAAVELYLGQFAPGFDSEWVCDRRMGLESKFLGIATALIDILLADSAWPGAADICRRVLDYDPYNEAACYGLMKARAAMKDFESALRSFRVFREAMRTDLGEMPGVAITHLYAELRNHLGRTASHPP